MKKLADIDALIAKVKAGATAQELADVHVQHQELAKTSVAEHVEFTKMKKAKMREDKKRLDKATLELVISEQKARLYKQKAEKSKKELLQKVSRAKTAAYHQGQLDIVLMQSKHEHRQEVQRPLAALGTRLEYRHQVLDAQHVDDPCLEYHAPLFDESYVLSSDAEVSMQEIQPQENGYQQNHEE